MFTTAVQVDLIGSHGLLILCPKSRCGPSNSPKLVCGAVSQRLAMSAHLRGSALDWPAWRVPMRYVRRIFVQPGPGLVAHRGTYVSFARQFGDADELRAGIRTEIEAGADLIKVALSGWNEGARPEHAPDIPFDEILLTVAVDEAHRLGFKIACHANDPTSCRIAAHAGVDSLEHGMFLQGEDLDAMRK